MAEKITTMVLKVDLECTKCYKKVKKLLCKYPHIRDQEYDEKANTVTIKVVCCSPEKLRDKLCDKGRGTIRSIDIIEPEKKKPPPPEPQKPKLKPVENPPDQKPKDTPQNVTFVVPTKVDTPKPPPVKAPEPIKAPEPVPKTPEPVLVPVPITAYPPPYYMPPRVCCGTCYEGRPGGPCYGGHGMLMPMAPPCNCGCGGRSNCYYGYGGGRGYTICRSDYFIEENPSACRVM